MLILERIADQDRVLTLRAGRNQCHRAVDQLLNAADVLDRLGRQLRPASRAVGRFLPAFDPLVNWFNRGLIGGMGGEIVEHLVAKPVAGADQHLVQPVEDVQLRSEEHTSELQSLMRISYAVFCLKKKKK